MEYILDGIHSVEYIKYRRFLLLDCLLFQGKYKEKIVIPGTEGHKDYEFNNWMKHLAIREHFLLVPFFLVPIIATIQALFVGFLGR